MHMERTIKNLKLPEKISAKRITLQKSHNLRGLDSNHVV